MPGVVLRQQPKALRDGACRKPGSDRGLWPARASGDRIGSQAVCLRRIAAREQASGHYRRRFALCERMMGRTIQFFRKILAVNDFSAGGGSLSRIRTYDHSINSRELYR